MHKERVINVMNKDNKYHLDHRKFFWESKTIGHCGYDCPYSRRRYFRRKGKTRAAQVAQTIGEIYQSKLYDHGLYVAKYISSLKLPTKGYDLKKLRRCVTKICRIEIERYTSQESSRTEVECKRTT